MRAEIERRALAEGCADGLEYVVLWLESGGSVLALSEELSASCGVEISRGMVTRYLETWGDEGRQAIARARELGADAKVDLAESILSQPYPTRDAMQAAKYRADVLLWRAERESRKQYGRDAGPTVHISFGSLHLQALMAPAEVIEHGASAPKVLTSHVNATSQVDDAQEVSIETVR